METEKKKKERALLIIERLKEEYPDAGCTLDYNEAWKLLVSVRLAAQCTDARVNVVVQGLYEKYPSVAALAEADVAFHEIIYQASDNKRLNQVLNNLREQMYRYRVEYLKEEQTRNLLVSEHEELVKAIREGDVQKAQDISFHHLENQRMAIIRTIRAENAARESEKKE